MAEVKGTIAAADHINIVIMADDPLDRIYVARSVDGLMLRQEDQYIFLTHEQCIALRDYMSTTPWRDKESG